MSKKEKIFNLKKPFSLKYSLPDQYRFAENKDKGELINSKGEVVAQIFDTESIPSGFVVAAIFMGEPTFKTIYYDRVIFIEEHISTSSSLASQVLT